MAKREKRINRIVEAVQSIIGDDVKRKKLKKAKALESFIGKMEKKKAELKKQLTKERGDLSDKRIKELERNVKTLDKQIDKAEHLLKELKKK